eukprot:jgi/Psemu1/326049/estExt_fgenesh1_pg.C_3190011
MIAVPYEYDVTGTCTYEYLLVERELRAALEDAVNLSEYRAQQLSDCSNRLRQREVDHDKELLLRFETEEQARRDLRTAHQRETKSLRDAHQRETKSLRDALETTREELRQTDAAQKEQAEEHQRKTEEHQRKMDELRSNNEFLMQQLDKATSDNARLEELVATATNSRAEEWQSRIRTLEERHARELDYWKAQLDDQLERSEQKSIQMTAALEEARAQYQLMGRSEQEEQIARRVESKLKELEEQHSIELGYWKTRVDDQRRELDLSAIRMSTALEEARYRYAALERKHDKEVKEWQMLLDADFARGGEPERQQRSRLLNDSDSTTDSVVLDQTLHLLNNIKTMLSSPKGENEHEVSVLQHLEALSGLMHTQEESAKERLKEISELVQPHDLSTSSAVEVDVDVEDTNGSVHSRDPTHDHHRHPVRSNGWASRSGERQIDVEIETAHNHNDASWISAVRSAAAADPWPALVAELRSRCDFLERDRDDITRITAQILESERTSHSAELEAAVATAERKANETLHTLHMEKNREMNTFYQNICWQCQQQVSSIF